MDCCILGVRSSSVSEESKEEYTRSVSSTKLHPTKVILSFERGVMKCAPRSSERIMFKSGELIIAQIHGLAPFPWPLPWVGLPCLRTLPYELFEMPYPVLR